MDVILLKDYLSLGKTGDTVKVKPGFARNFLIPEGIALRASSKNLSIFKEQKKFEKVRQKREKSFNENIAKKLSKVEITIEAQVGEEDKMFGSITAKDIHKSIIEKGIKIEQNSIKLEKPIKALGIYNVDVMVTENISSTVKVYVIKS